MSVVSLQALSPFETKPIMRALFLGQREANHTAFIRIRTSGENSITSLVIPFEVEVSSGRRLALCVTKLVDMFSLVCSCYWLLFGC